MVDLPCVCSEREVSESLGLDTFSRSTDIGSDSLYIPDTTAMYSNNSYKKAHTPTQPLTGGLCQSKVLLPIVPHALADSSQWIQIRRRIFCSSPNSVTDTISGIHLFTAKSNVHNK